jgi:hypothetical protein
MSGSYSTHERVEKCMDRMPGSNLDKVTGYGNGGFHGLTLYFQANVVILQLNTSRPSPSKSYDA